MVKKKKEQRNCPSFFQFIGNDYLVTLFCILKAKKSLLEIKINLQNFF